VRVLFEFTPSAPGLPETERVERYIAADIDRFQRRIQRFVRKSFTSQDIGYVNLAKITGIHSYEVLESNAGSVRIRISFTAYGGNQTGTFDEIFLARFADDDIEFIERLGPARAGVSDDQDGRTQAAESAAAAPVDIRAYLASHEDEAAEALDNYIVASDQPYGKRLRELISHKVLEDRDVGSLVEFRYVGWDSPYAKQRVIARLEGGALTFYDPAAATRLAALPSVASDAIDPMVQVDDGSAEVAALTTGEALTEEKVLAYFDDNEYEMNRKLAAYTREQRLIATGLSSTVPKALILDASVLESGPDSSRIRITYNYGWLQEVQHTKHGTFTFHLKWIDDELVFVGHEPPGGAVVVTAPTPDTPLDTGAQVTDDSVITEFDGLWESKDFPWHGTLEIKDGRYRTDLICAATHKAKASGRVLPDGRLEDSYFGVGMSRGSMTGSIEELQLYYGQNICQNGILSFQRVTG
jgi:hypothetical protein